MDFGVTGLRCIWFCIVVCIVVVLGFIMKSSVNTRTNSLTRPRIMPDGGGWYYAIPRTFKHSCTLPAGGYKAWSQGVVTLMKPVISRNCTRLFQGDQVEAKRVEQENKAWDSTEFSNSFDEWTISGDCDRIKREFTKNLYTTKEEVEFPLAFSMNIHDNPQQIFRFLKVIYRPHNLYCLHYDKKAGDKIKKVTENVARCLDNVIIPQTHVNVIWGCYTIMEAQLMCMRELLKARSTSYPWRYTISLCGKEVPLRTLREIVVMLKRLNGTSGLPQDRISRHQLSLRFSKKAVIGAKNTCIKTTQNLGPVPYGAEIRISSAYFSLTPDFVYYLLNNRVSLDMYQYMKGAYNSEEHYFSTVYYMKGVPGGYNEKYAGLIPTVADVVWCYSDPQKRCKGLIVHGVSIITSSDLHLLNYKVDLNNIQGPLFHNKYFMEVDHTVMDCAEEQLIIRNKQEYANECKTHQ